MMFTIERILGDKLCGRTSPAAQRQRPQRQNDEPAESSAARERSREPAAAGEDAVVEVCRKRKSMSDGEDEISGETFLPNFHQ